LARDSRIEGFTTNPSLMKTAGVTDYERFAKDVLAIVPDKSVSFEVLASDQDGMIADALTIAKWGRNVFVKIPVVDPHGFSTGYAIQKLRQRGVQVNITAVMSARQVHTLQLTHGPAAYVSIFAGRIADTGVDPVAVVRLVSSQLADRPEVRTLWASAREVYNVCQARQINCDVITLSPDIIAKLSLFGKDLQAYSQQTVEQFTADAKAAGLSLHVSPLR
jgi:transaldolase